MTSRPSNPPREKAPGLSRRRLLGTAAVAGATGAVAPPLIGKDYVAPSTGPKMRRTDSRRMPSAAAKGLPAAPSTAIVALNRMGFGPRQGDIAAFNALGGNDAARLAAYIDQQLDPDSIDDTDLENRLAAANFPTYGLSDDPDTYLATLWDWYVNDNAPNGETSSSIPHDDMMRMKFVRAMYGKRQLVEVLAEFWHDHFNVSLNDSTAVRATLPHLDMVIRGHLLGRFRDLLEAVTRSSAMLYYLDNYTSSNSGPNENFCRELFELHTLGAENYLGVLQQNEVPTDGQGRPVGYVDADVFEATRAFTGWSISYGVGGDDDSGLFLYRPDWHDRFQKNVLGVFLPADQPDQQDGADVLDALASHPGTGRYIARKLVRKFIADDPPQTVVDAAAAVFTDQWQAPDQLEQVYRVILGSPEFRTTWGQKIKRPFHIAASALRATTSSFTPQPGGDTTQFMNRFDDAGHESFHWAAPNGYPDVREAWRSMTPIVGTWRLVGWLIDFRNESDVYYLNVPAQTPPHVRSANALADYWIDRILHRPMDPADRQSIVEFMGQGINPDFDLDLTDEGTSDRLRSMVALILMSPDFLWR